MSTHATTSERATPSQLAPIPQHPHTPSICRPLFVAEVEFRAAKVFTRTKRTLLVLNGAELQIIDVAALEAAEGAPPGESPAVGVLRLVNYSEVWQSGTPAPPCLCASAAQCRMQQPPPHTHTHIHPHPLLQ